MVREIPRKGRGPGLDSLLHIAQEKRFKMLFVLPLNHIFLKEILNVNNFLVQPNK